MTKKTDKKKDDIKLPAPSPSLVVKKISTGAGSDEHTGISTPLGFPVVGMGASAGGVAAFEAFFSSMPSDTEPGMAFVLIQHQSPDFKSRLADIISRDTSMPVLEVEEGMKLSPNHVYIVPPGRDTALLGGAFQLMGPVLPLVKRMSIDFFFRTLAHDQREKAIGVVFSGTASDGSAGIRAIKGEGGMVMVQSRATAEYDSMPRSCLATGLVDYELSPEEMPARLAAYVAHAFARPPVSDSPALPGENNLLSKVFVLIRTQTGHDFSQYKPSTIRRRIERRMAVHQIDNLSYYVKFIQRNSAEVEALFRDMLIGVTSFFRDKEAFEVLGEQAVAKIFAARPARRTIRVWVPGCSTGEEAYSLAMLFAEYRKSSALEQKIKIFATDIDSQAITFARAGLYPVNIVNDIGPERLERFFDKELNGNVYQIKKNIRKMLVFSEHNILKEPPFIRLDLISCRNLMIYLDDKLQKKLIPLFHYSLNPQGFLFLGTSESIGGFRDLFAAQNRKYKIFLRKNDTVNSHHTLQTRALPSLPAQNASVSRSSTDSKHPRKLSLRELTEKALLQQMAPVAALINSQGDILYLHGRTGQYLEPAPGEAGVNNILLMAREGLRLELTTALHKAVVDQKVVFRPDLRVKTNGEVVTANLSVRRVQAPLPGSREEQSEKSDGDLYLVVLEKTYQQSAIPGKGGSGADKVQEGAVADEDAQEYIATLQKELRARDEYIQSTFEELESSNEELSSSNEELQSVNEELHSANEELETSKEELQSVNDELHASVIELSQANNDMRNLLASTGIGTLFVDMNLCIVRYTPEVTRVVNLIDADNGRPLGHFSLNLKDYNTLVDDTRDVLDTLIPREVEVQTKTGEWFLMHIRPYRTRENTIEGAIITFVEITSRKKMEEELRAANIQQAKQQLFEDVVNTVKDPMLVLDKDLHVVLASRAFYDTFQVKQDETLGRVIYDLGNRQWDIPAMRKLLEQDLPDNGVCDDFEMSHDFEGIGHRSMSINARRIAGRSESSSRTLLVIEDVTSKKNKENS
ncbi:MAG: CheR family methyltransferase [Desulfonatronovibrio sp.]